MPYKKRSSHTKKTILSVTKGMGAGALVVLALVAIAIMVQSFLAKEKVVSQVPPVKLAMVTIEEPTEANSEIDGKYYGLCKKNSVQSVDDFRAVVSKDPVLNAHFAGFNWETARIGKQENAVWTYVSYRKDEIIRRTSNAVRLPKGDEYVTDGSRVVRTFCCNDYVEAPPPRQVSMAAPPTERVDAPSRRAAKSGSPIQNLSPLPSVVDPPKVSASPTVEESPSVIAESFANQPNPVPLPPYPSGLPYRNYSTSKGKHPYAPPTAVPEPGTFLLMGAGVAAFSLVHLLRRKRGES